jgi:hypothetical protein
MHIASIGIDLGKTTFHLVALGERSKVLLHKKFSRSQLLAYTANLSAALIGLEACAGSHFMGAALREQGHEVRLILAQFVKPYGKSARGVLFRIEYDTGGLGQWVHRLSQRAPRNKVIVAIANELERIAWAVLSSGGLSTSASVVLAGTLIAGGKTCACKAKSAFHFFHRHDDGHRVIPKVC